MKEYNVIQQVIFRGLEGGAAICDITLNKASKYKNEEGEIILIPPSILTGVKIKINESNQELLNKISHQRKRTKIWLTCRTEIPLGIYFETYTIENYLTNKEYQELKVQKYGKKPRKRRSNKAPKEEVAVAEIEVIDPNILKPEEQYHLF